MSKISVIMPVYNCENYLAESLESLINQTHQNLEIIIINDGSTDNSMEICKRYAENDHRIVLLNQRNQGPAAARNLALDNATGDYIAFLDADDFMELNSYEKLLKSAKKYDTQMVVCGFNFLYDNTVTPCESSVQDGLYINERCKEILDEMVFPLKEHYMHAYLWNRLIKRDLIESDKQRFDVTLRRSSDYPFLVLLVKKLDRIYLMEKEKLVYYRQQSSSITHKYLADYWPMVLTIYDKLRKENLDIARLNLMLIGRGRNAIYLEALSPDSYRNRYERLKKISSNKTLRNAINTTSWQVGKKYIGISFLLIRLKLNFPLFLFTLIRNKEL